MWRARRWDVQFEVGEICSILGGFSRREGAQCAFFINWHAAFARLWLACTVHFLLPFLGRVVAKKLFT